MLSKVDLDLTLFLALFNIELRFSLAVIHLKHQNAFKNLG